MQRKFLKTIALATISIVTAAVHAQEEQVETPKLPFNLSGSVDAYYGVNLNTSNNANSIDSDAENYKSSFYKNDGFSVGMVNLVASKQVGKVGFVADLAYGPTADEAIEATGTGVLINQLFVTYAPSESVNLTLGRFNTFLGYEVISPVGNFNYSTSHMFTNGPFTHSGLKADFALNENWSLMTAIMNSTTSGVEGNEQGKYTGGLQVGYSNGKGSAYLNTLYGRNELNTQETFQVDLTTGWDFSEDFYLGLNTTYNDTDGSGFYGAALYPQLAVNEAFSLGLRGEYFNRFAEGADDESVFSTTLTGAFTEGALTIKPEVRLDAWGNDVEPFTNNNGDATNQLSRFTLAAIYSF